MRRLITSLLLIVAAFFAVQINSRADILYTETFGVPASNTTDPAATNADWARFGNTGVALTGGAISASASGTGRPTDAVQTTSAGPVTDGTFNTYAKGFFYLAATPSPSLGLTTEYSFDPANYIPGSIIFSWYEGNNTANHFFQLMVRVGGVWYANNNTTTTAAIALASFGSSAVSNALTYDPTAANWKIVNFNGNYTLGGTPGTGTTTDSTLGTVSLGAAPGSDLSGPITGFGFYTFTSGTASGNRRIDTFTIYATPIGGGPTITGTNVWKGTVDGTSWDTNTANWATLGGAQTNYLQNSYAIFDDTAGNNTNINLTITATNGGILVSNTVPYLWSGSGTIVGFGGLTKKNSGSLIIANTTANGFSGAVDLQAGTIQVGNGNADVNAGNLGNGPLTNNGALLVNIGNGGSVNIGNNISGNGTFTNLGAGTLNLSGASTFANGLQIQAGTVRVGGPNALGAGTAFVNTNAILVLGSATTNSMTLAGATLAVANGDFTMATNADLMITAGTTNVLLSADPLASTTSRNLQVDGRLRGSGTIVVKNADSILNPDASNGVRFRNTNAVSDFTGTIIVTNNAKSELLVSGPGPFSPANTGKFFLYCGIYSGFNTTNADPNTGYPEFNIRNNYTNDTVIGNDIELLGTASPGTKNAVVLNVLGNAPSGAVSTLGNLKIGDSQELIGFKNAASTTNGVKFSSVTLKGGTATFSPHSSDFGLTNQAGAFLILNDVGESVAGSGIVMNGLDSLTLTGTSTYTGPTVVQQGKLLINSLNISGGVVTNLSGSTLGGTGTNSGLVEADGTLAPGNTGSAGTFTAPGTLIMNGPLSFDIGANNTVGGGVNDLVEAGNLNLSSGTATVVVNPLVPNPQNATYRVADYTTKSGTFAGDPAPVARLQFHLDYSTPNQVNMTVTGGPAVSRWVSLSDPTWDNAGQVNWNTNNLTSANAQFQPNDTVILDDLVSAVQTNLTLTQSVVPGWITNNSSVNFYSISNSGSIGGSGGLTKLGNSTLTITTTNSFTGPTVISAGVVKVSNATNLTSALGALPGGSVTITNTGALDLGGNLAQNTVNFGAKQFFINGGGFGGNGTIVSSGGTQQQNAFQKITLLGNSTVGGGVRWDMRNGTPVLDLAGFKLTKTGSNQISLVSTLVTSGDIDINQGDLSFETSSTVTNSGTITINPNGFLGFFRLFGGAMTRSIVLNGGAITNAAGGGATNDSPINITANGTLTCLSGNDLYLRGPISGVGGLTKINSGGVIFSGTNTYSGNTIISNGTVTLLDGTTSLTNSPTVIVGNTNSTLDLTLRSNSVPAKTITVVSGQTLNESGNIIGTVLVNSGGVMTGAGGTVASNFTISAGGFLLPGGTNGIGKINVGLSPTLSGRTVIEIDKSNGATNDQVFAGGPVIYGGTLTVTNIGPALASGDTFKIFNGASYPTFFTLDLANPGVNLSWVTNRLNVDGTLSVTSNVAPGPTTNATITSVTRSGTNMLVHGTNNNVPNTSFHFVVLTSPNLTNALSNWTPVITNPFNPDGTFDFTNPIVPGTPQQFIDVKAVP